MEVIPSDQNLTEMNSVGGELILHPFLSSLGGQRLCLIHLRSSR